MAIFRRTTFFWFTEKPGDGPREEYQPGASRVAAPVDVVPGTATARTQAALDFLGWNNLRQGSVGGTQRNYISRQTPMQYPAPAVLEETVDDARPRYASSLLQGTGLGIARTPPGPEAAVDYEQYRWTLTFHPYMYQVLEDGEVPALAGSPLTDGTVSFPDEGSRLKKFGWHQTRYVERRLSEAVRLITIPTGFLKYAGGSPVRFNFPWTEVTGWAHYVWHQVPYLAIPWRAMASMLGSVDPTPFDFTNSLAGGGAGGTLMYCGADVQQAPGPFGDILATITHKFFFSPKWSSTEHKALGHNAAVRIKPGGAIDYEGIVSSADSLTPPFRTTTDGTTPVDFGALFRPD